MGEYGNGIMDGFTPVVSPMFCSCSISSYSPFRSEWLLLFLTGNLILLWPWGNWFFVFCDSMPEARRYRAWRGEPWLAPRITPFPHPRNGKSNTIPTKKRSG